MTALPRFDDFAADRRAAGFDEVLERTWKPGTVVDTHTHDFAVDALVVQGEMWLTDATTGRTQHLVAGDRFTLGHGVPHAERYGDAGATYWAARRAAVAG